MKLTKEAFILYKNNIEQRIMKELNILEFAGVDPL